MVFDISDYYHSVLGHIYRMYYYQYQYTIFNSDLDNASQYCILSVVLLSKRGCLLKQNGSDMKTRIKECRAQNILTQQDLADIVGVRRETIVFLEKGRYNPSLRLVHD